MPVVAPTVRQCFFYAGGIGLIPLGILDSSVLPFPGILEHGRPVALSICLVGMAASTTVFYSWRAIWNKKRSWIIGERFS
jgi:hypothetical protein